MHQVRQKWGKGTIQSLNSRFAGDCDKIRDMKLFYVYEMTDDRAKGDEAEVRHLSKVMRKNVGDLAYITHGDGKLWQAEIMALGRSSVTFKPLKLVRDDREKAKVAVAVAPTKKPSRIEDLVEKGVQMGLTDLYLIHTERTLRKVYKTSRLEQLAISAMKQCLRTNLPRIHQMTSYSDFLTDVGGAFAQKYTGKIEGDNRYLIEEVVDQDVLILIGPEGDFTDEEYQAAKEAGFKAVKLSEQRLRTEAAGIMAIAAVQHKRQLNAAK